MKTDASLKASPSMSVAYEVADNREVGLGGAAAREREDAFRDVVERYRDMVFRIAYTYMRDPADADDVTQDVFVKLLRQGKAFESDEHLRFWLVRVTVNECKSLFRKPWRRTEDIEAYAGTLSMPSDGHAALFSSVMRLPEKLRIPLVLFYYGGFSTSEIAAMLHVSGAAVRKRLSRARSKLKVELEVE